MKTKKLSSMGLTLPVVLAIVVAMAAGVHTAATVKGGALRSGHSCLPQRIVVITQIHFVG